MKIRVQVACIGLVLFYMVEIKTCEISLPRKYYQIIGNGKQLVHNHWISWQELGRYLEATSQPHSSIKGLVKQSGILIKNSLSFYGKHYKTINVCLIGLGGVLYISKQFINAWALKKLKKKTKKLRKRMQALNIEQQKDEENIQEFLQGEKEEIQERKEALNALFFDINNGFDSDRTRIERMLTQSKEHRKNIELLRNTYSLLREQTISEQKEQESVNELLDNADKTVAELKKLSEESIQIRQELIKQFFNDEKS